MTPTLVLIAGLAVAQPPADGGVPPADVQRLARRVLRLDPGDVPKLDLQDPASIKKFLDANPALKREVEKQVRDIQQLPLNKQKELLEEYQKRAADPAVRQQIEQALGEQASPPTPRPKRGSTPPPGRQPVDPQPSPDDGRPTPPEPKDDDQRPYRGSTGGPPLNARTPQPPASTPTAPSRAGYDKFVRFFEQNVGPLKDMPAVQQLAKELFRGQSDGGPAGSDAGPLGSLLDSKTAGDLLKGLPEVGGRGDGWKLPDVAGLPEVSGSSLPAGELTAPSVPSASVLGVVIGLVAGAVVLVVLLKWLPTLAGGDGPRPVPGLGPWPLDPRRVMTRDDLVLAFEYLSVLLNGDPARAYSHETAAAALRQAVPDAADAAAPLADAYALARYTLADRPLSADQIADARRHLCRLAGVPAE